MLKVYGDAFMIATRLEQPSTHSATHRERVRRPGWLARALGRIR